MEDTVSMLSSATYRWMERKAYNLENFRKLNIRVVGGCKSGGIVLKLPERVYRLRRPLRVEEAALDGDDHSLRAVVGL